MPGYLCELSVTIATYNSFFFVEVFKSICASSTRAFLHMGLNLKSSSALSGMTETIKKLTKVSCCPNPTPESQRSRGRSQDNSRELTAAGKMPSQLAVAFDN